MYFEIHNAVVSFLSLPITNSEPKGYEGSMRD